MKPPIKKLPRKKGFLDFILDARTDRQLVMEFLLYMHPDDLYNFFRQKGYAVTKEEVQKILEIRRFLASQVTLQCIDDYY